MMFAVFITGLLVYTSDYNCTSPIPYCSVINISYSFRILSYPFTAMLHAMYCIFSPEQFGHRQPNLWDYLPGSPARDNADASYAFTVSRETFNVALDGNLPYPRLQYTTLHFETGSF